MTDREKLIALLNMNISAFDWDIEAIADDLITNGVTFTAYTEEDVRNAYNNGYSLGMEQGINNQKRGTWSLRYGFLDGTSFERYYIECSECGRKVEILDEDVTNWGKIEANYPYCHCGAYMMKEVE